MTSLVRIILASQSPRRRQLLEESGYRFDVLPPHESAESADAAPGDPAELVELLARRKAADVARQVPAGIVIG
jgi:septum formation protein